MTEFFFTIIIGIFFLTQLANTKNDKNSITKDSKEELERLGAKIEEKSFGDAYEPEKNRNRARQCLPSENGGNRQNRGKYRLWCDRAIHAACGK